MKTYTVSGIWPDSHKRWSTFVAAAGFDEAETKARILSCPGMLIASIVEGAATIYTSGRPADLGPGAPGYELSLGQLNEDPSSPPAVGNLIYVPYSDGGHWSSPHCLAGIATVTAVEGEGSRAVIQVAEHPGHSMSWGSLAKEQRKVHEDHPMARAGQHQS